MSGITFQSPSGSPVIDAREWVGRSPSTSDKGALLQRAFKAAWEAGGAEVRLPPWEVVTGRTLEYYGGTTISGHGPASSLKLGDSTNVDVLRPRSYGAGGQDNYRLEKFVVNGNRSHNASGSGCVSDGRKAEVACVWAHDCAEHGIYHTQSAADLPKQEGGMDFFGSHWRTWHNGKDGALIEHHDSIIENVQAINNDRANFHFGANAYASKMSFVHGWGLAEYAIWAEGSFQAINCEAEGASLGQVRTDGGGSWIGGGAFCVTPNLNVPGFLITANAARLMTVGVGVHTCGTGGAFNFSAENAGSGSKLHGIIDDNTEAIVGTPSSNIQLDLRLRGGSTKGSAWPIYSVVAAEALSVEGLPIIRVTGATEIKSFSAPHPGPYTLRFTSTAKVVDGGNLKLASNFEGGENRTLSGVYDGTNFYETARSTN